MKLFAYLMAVLVLALSCLPCADGVSDDKVTSEVSSHSGQDENDHEDDCSPFCFCVCCTSFTAMPDVEAESVLTAFRPVHHASLYISVPAEVFLPIWQPPKLG